MSIWIRKIVGDKSESYLKLAEDDWDLRSQFKTFETWLKSSTNALEADAQWIADIGFSPRDGACGGGPVISREIMKFCLNKKITIYFSEYDSSDE